MKARTEDLENILSKIRKARDLGSIADCIELCRKGISLVSPDQFEDWYALKINLAAFITKSSERSYSGNIEEAIEIHFEVLSKLSKKEHPLRWASEHRNLAHLFSERIEGDKENNLDSCIAHSTKALTIFTKEKFPEDWAMIKALIGLAYGEKKKGKDKQSIAKAIENYLDTLLVYTNDRYPKDYKDSLQELTRLRKMLNDEESWKMLFSKFQI